MLTLLLWCFTAEVSSFPALFHPLLPSRPRVTVGKTDFFVHAGAISQASVSHHGVSPPRSCTGYSDCVQDLRCELTKYDSQLRAQKSLSLALGPNRLSSGRNLGNGLRPLNHVTELKRKKKKKPKTIGEYNSSLATAQPRTKKKRKLGANDEDLTPCD